MKFKLFEIRSLEGSLSKLTHKEVPIKLAYRLGKVLQVISKELSTIEVLRSNLVKKYSDEADEKGNFKVKLENEDTFRKEFADLLQEEIDIECEPFNLSELEGIVMTPIDIIRLDKLIIAEEKKG